MDVMMYVYIVYEIDKILGNLHQGVLMAEDEVVSSNLVVENVISLRRKAP